MLGEGVEVGGLSQSAKCCAAGSASKGNLWLAEQGLERPAQALAAHREAHPAARQAEDRFLLWPFEALSPIRQLSEGNEGALYTASWSDWSQNSVPPLTRYSLAAIASLNSRTVSYNSAYNSQSPNQTNLRVV